jgi:Leu/Phe-tRNA-protein transferase
LIDCQVYTEHLESLGAKMMSRKEFYRHPSADPEELKLKVAAS